MHVHPLGLMDTFSVVSVMVNSLVLRVPKLACFIRFFVGNAEGNICVYRYCFIGVYCAFDADD